MGERRTGEGVEALRRTRRELFEKRKVSGNELEALTGAELCIKGITYTLKECIGSGGFAEVWSAQTPSGEEVAVKLSNECKRSRAYLALDLDHAEIADLSQEDWARIEVAENVQRLWREVAAAKKLGKEGSPYPRFIAAQFVPAPENSDMRMLALITERIHGDSFETFIGHEGIQDPERVLFFAKQIADAIKYTHDAGFVHRDIKPDNMLIEANGRVRVVDVGIAAFKNPKKELFLPYEETHRAFDVGATGFMQRGEEDPFSPARDVYAAGKTFMQMLMGTNAFKNARTRARKKAELHDPRLQRLAEIMEKMIDEVPEQRPTIEQVVEEIQRLI